MRKVLWLSDLDVKGSGYASISVPLCEGLVNAGFDLKVIGLGYRGEEHKNSFPIIPAQNFNEIFAMMQNLFNLWQYEVLVVALDIPLQENILKVSSTRPFKYVGIMPVEADPLCFSWSMVLMQMDKVFIISEFGAKEAQKVGVNAEHIQVGIDSSFWRPPTEEERKLSRKSLFAVNDNEFVILTVADNQERKNLSRAMEIFKDFHEQHPNSKYVLVTREHNLVGWKLRDYALELGINNDLLIFERGLSPKDLWSIYAGADCFLLTSKAEGYGMPIIEAMAVGIPCLATDCTSSGELVSEGRGWGIKPDYIYRDPFGNGRRYLTSREHGLYQLMEVYDLDNLVKEKTKTAREYVETLTWDKGIEQLINGIKEVTE